MSKKILLVFASLLTLALIIAFAVFAYLQFADLNRFKPQISQHLTQYLGRSVALDGDLSVKILPLSLSLSDAKITNSPWGSTPNMLSVKRLDLQLGLLPLLTGELLISKFVLQDVQVIVEHNEQGENNWRLLESKEPKTKARHEPTTLPLDFDTEVNIDIRNIVLSHRQSPASPWREFVLNQAVINGLSDLNALQVDIAGQFDNHVYKIYGRIGALADLLSADKKYPIDLHAHVLNADWEVNGAIKNVLKLEQVQLNIKAYAKDLIAWQQWMGASIQYGPINFNADIDGNLNNLTISNLLMQVGSATVNGKATLDMATGKPNIIAKLNIKDIHTEEFIDAIQSEPDKKSEIPQVVKVESENNVVDLSFLQQFDSSVMISAASVGYQEWVVDQFDAELKVQEGQLSLAPFSIVSKLGQASGNFSLASVQNVNLAKLDVDAKDLALGKYFDTESTYQAIGALKGSIHTQGKSWTDLYANLQGKVVASYVNKEHKHDTKITLIRSKPKTSATPFDVVINGELQKVPYKITGEIGGPMALLDDAPYPATAHLTFLNVDTKANGTIAHLFRAEGFDIAFDARTENLGKLNQQIDIGLPDLKKTQVQAMLRGDYERLKFDNINAISSSAQVSGNVQLDFKKEPLNITGDLTVNKFDFTGLQKEIAAAHKAKSSETAKSQESTLEKTLSFSALQGFNMRIRVSSVENGGISIPNFPITRFDAQISVAESALSVSQLSIESPMGNIASEFRLDAEAKVPTFEVRLASSSFDLERFEFDNEEQLFWQAFTSADVALRTQGDTIQQWLEYISGHVTLSYQQKEYPQTFALRLAREAQKVTAPVSVRINTKIGETTSLGSGSVSAPLTWLQGGPPTKLDFETNVKDYVAQVQGEIEDLVSGDGMDVRVSFSNRQVLTDTFDPNDLINRVGEVQLFAEIKGNYSSIVASQLEGFVGEGKISGSTSVNFSAQPAAVEFDLDIDGLDISKWATNDTKSSISHKKTDKIFSDTKLPFSVLKAATIKGNINGENIQFKRVLATKLDAAVDLRDGVLQFGINRLLTNQGELIASLHVDSNETPPQLSLKLDVPILNMAEFARNTAAEGLIKGDFSADISLSSVGDSIAELAAGLDGHMRILMEKGAIDSTLLNIYSGGVSALVGMLTAADVKSTRVNCGICGLRFTKGKAVSEVVLLDTQYSTLVAEGWVNLANETLSVKASPVKKGLRLNMELPVVVQGELSGPKVSTQPTSALNTAAEIATVWFIPTTAIFIAYDALRSGDKNPCVNMMAPTKESAGLRALKGAGKAFGDIGSVFSKGLSALLGEQVEQRPQDEKLSE